MSSTRKFIFMYTKARLFIFIRNKILKKQTQKQPQKKKPKRGGGSVRMLVQKGTMTRTGFSPTVDRTVPKIPGKGQIIILSKTRMPLRFIEIQKLVSNGLSPTTPMWTTRKWWSYSDVITLTITRRPVGAVLWSENVLNIAISKVQ